MPRFHFHLVIDGDRNHIGSMDLPNKDAVLPTGLKITVRLLANVAREDAEGRAWVVQATDEMGAIVYNFDASGRVADRGPSGYVH